MATMQQIEALRSRAIEIAATHEPRSESIETLSEMMEGFDLTPTDDPEEMAATLFESPEMAQHLETLAMQDFEFPRLDLMSDLNDLRGALLL